MHHALVAFVFATKGELAVCILADTVIVIVVVLVDFGGQLDLLYFVKCECDGRFFLHEGCNWLSFLDRLGVWAGTLHVVDRKDDVLVDLFVHGQLSSLAEGAIASIEVTLEWFLLSVNVGVFFQVLGKSERLET